ncbi:MAG: hypothetical protein CR986_10390 [Ignavibacteriae bacterium]|nr:MAG: hypothetical protein CR986_10390 [Ignavibacteriota bacterium]
MLNDNPFLLNTYIKPKYFCGRENETNLLLNFIEKNKSTFIKGEKGIGKSTFLLSTLYKLKKKNKNNLILIDFKKVLDYSNFLDQFIKNASKALNFNNEIDLPNDKSLNLSLSNLHKAIKEKTIFAFDNFDIDDKRTRNKIEDFIEKEIITKGYLYIFTSNSHKLAFNFDKELSLEEIDTKEYKNFIKKHFKTSNIKIKSKTIKYIQEICKNDITSIQKLCFRLWENKKNIDTNLVNKTIEDIIIEHESDYLTVKNLLSLYQWKLLTAIARKDITDQFTSSNFIKKYSLNAPSSVKTATNALLEKGIIIKNSNGNYFVKDTFLQLWIKETLKN